MKVTVVGCKAYDFKDEESGRQVTGLSVYYYAPADGVKGNIAGKLSIKSGSDLYHRMMSMDYAKAVPAEAVFEVMPGNNRAVLTDIRI